MLLDISSGEQMKIAGVIVILGEMGKGEVREKMSFKSRAVFWICSDYSCRDLCWHLTDR